MANYYFDPNLAAAAAAAVAMPGTPTSDTDSHRSGPLPTELELQAMSPEQLAAPLDPQLFLDLRGMAPTVVTGLMAPPAATAAAMQPQPGLSMPPMDIVPPPQVVPPAPAHPPPPVAPTPTPPPPLGAPPALSSGTRAGTRGGGGAGGGGKRNSRERDAEVERREQRKQLRAERNRQSAAASRERKKAHLRELQRRLELLLHDNARIEAELELARQRMAHEMAMLHRKQTVEKLIATGRRRVAALQGKVVAVAAEHRAATTARALHAPVALAPAPAEAAAAATPLVASPVPAPAVAPAGAGAGDDGRPKVLRKPRTWDSNALGDASRKFAF